MKHLILLFTLIPFLALAGNQQIYGKDGIPKKPTPERLVNIIGDAPQVLSNNEINALESDLVDFSKSTGVQIVLVVVPSLNGFEKEQMATEIGHQWGVGEKGKDNGIVILLKPKTSNSKGHVFIATGYGLEGVIPDAIAKRIVEAEMIPSFKKKDYYSGVSNAIKTLKSLALQEFSAKEYLSRTDNSSGIAGIIPFIIFALIFFLLKRRGARRTYSSSSVPFWTAMFLGGSIGNTRTGGWNDFSSGSGGFGGFGGGGFGGGGAGGSW